MSATMLYTTAQCIDHAMCGVNLIDHEKLCKSKQNHKHPLVSSLKQSLKTITFTF